MNELPKIDNQFKPYFDEYGLLHPTPGEYSDNGIMFTAIYWILCSMLGQKVPREYVEKIIHQHKDPLNAHLFLQKPWDYKDPGSHDNMTSIVALSKWFDVPISFATLPRYLHPRDVIIYGYAKYPNVFRWFLWIPSLMMIYSCTRLLKRKPSTISRFFTWVKSGFKYWPTTRLKIHTDGKILTWLRCHSLGLHTTWKICAWILRDKFGPAFMTEIFKTYFRDSPNHPIIKRSAMLYGE